MTSVALVTALLVAAVTLLHCEALQGIQRRLGELAMPARPKVPVVMAGGFLGHGGLVGAAADPQATLDECLYFSGATCISPGLGDRAPTGPLRLLAAAQALHGLLLIGWTASFLCIAMERFWSARRGR
jgi:hypothetical protein